MMKMRIEIIGALGCGKTTLLDRIERCSLGQHLVTIREDLSEIEQERTFWTNDTQSRSFFIQTVYYLHRVQQINNAIRTCHDVSIIISDFGLCCDHFVYSMAFRRMGNLSEVEWHALDRLYDLAAQQLPQLRGLIYRRCSSSNIVERLRIRKQEENRQGEPQELVNILVNTCEEYITHCSLPVLIVDHDLISMDSLQLEKTLSNFLREVGSNLS